MLRITVRPFQDVRVSVPLGLSLESAGKMVESKQEWIKKQLSNVRSYEESALANRKNNVPIDVEAACEHLYQRLIFLAQKFNFGFNRITFRIQKTRWGSCSHKNNLNLNVKLIKLPQELQDYVILHELVHTKVKNHSPLFWQEMEKALPEAKKLNKELSKYKLITI